MPEGRRGKKWSKSKTHFNTQKPLRMTQNPGSKRGGREPRPEEDQILYKKKMSDNHWGLNGYLLNGNAIAPLKKELLEGRDRDKFPIIKLEGERKFQGDTILLSRVEERVSPGKEWWGPQN